MPDSLGGLVDRLSIVNIKLWFVQAQVFDCDRTDTDLPADSVKKLTSLNLERNYLATAIDKCLDEAVRSGKAQVDARIKIT